MRKKLFYSLVAIFVIFSFILSINLAAKDSQPKPDKKILKEAKKLRKKGDKELKKKNFDEAIKYYLESLKLYPDDEKANVNIAYAYLKKGDYENSLNYYEKAYKINPKIKGVKETIIQVCQYLGSNYQRSRKPEKAVIYYEKLLNYIEVNDKNMKNVLNLYYLLGLDYYSIKKFEKSIGYFEKIIKTENAQKISPDLVNMSYYLLGLDYTMLKDIKNATSYLQKYIDLMKDNKDDRWLPFAYYIYGKNYYSEMEKKIKEIEKKKDYKIEEVNKIAKSYYKNIEPYFKKALELKPIEDAYVDLGNFYYYAGEKEKALETYEELIKNFPASKERYKKFVEKLKKDIQAEQGK